jgi:hypothetical protein
LHKFLLYKNCETFYLCLLILVVWFMRKETQKFIYGIYKASDRAESNLFTSKNSVIKLCSGAIYLGENL